MTEGAGEFGSWGACSGGGKQKKDKTTQILQIIEQCDVVTVANLRLQEKIRHHVEDTHFVPNGMWVEKYAPEGLPRLCAEAIPDRIVFTNADFIKLESSKKTAKELDRFIIDKLSLDQMIPELE